MHRLYYLVQQAKFSDMESITEIIRLFNPKIKQTSRFIDNFEREDLEQELKFQIFIAVIKFKTTETPGFREFIRQLPEQRRN